MSARLVVSLFDYSGAAVQPWADAGFRCLCFDLLHREEITRAGVTYIPADLDPGAAGWSRVRQEMERSRGGVLFAWPPCDDMTSSGNRHLAGKLARDPDIQKRAAARAIKAAAIADEFGFSWLVENPIGALCTLWRSPDRIWNPCDFGGYLEPELEHPVWPRHIAPRDAYTKKTGAWLGGGFIFPEPLPVEPEILEHKTKSGRTLRGSRQFMLLGGSSAKTKAIRNLTPRGAARAFFLSNKEPKP